MEPHRKRKQASLMNFFAPKQTKKGDSSQVEPEETPAQQMGPVIVEEEEHPIVVAPAAVSKFDIGFYAGKPPKDRQLKFDLLTKPWVPDESYLDQHKPHAMRNVKGEMRPRYLSLGHLTRYPWTVFSHVSGGLFCKWCVLFAPRNAGRGGQQLKMLVTEPCNTYHRLLGTDGYLVSHNENEYHKAAKSAAEQFTRSFEGDLPDVTMQLRNQNDAQIQQNRSALRSIIRAILVCGRCGLPLRGHRECGSVLDDSGHDGVFREILRAFCDVGDIHLEQHLRTAPKNALYTSKMIQNELIDLIGNSIMDIIVERVNSAKFFAVIADESPDVSHKEQLTICLRYCRNGAMYEDFLKFTIVDNVTGHALADCIINELIQRGINMEGMVGLAFDGASAMRGHINGAQAKIREKYSIAIYVHCYSHRLNLVISQSSKVQAIRNCWGTVESITNFLAPYPMRNTCLERHVNEMETPEHRKLKTFCETRFLGRQDGILVFESLLPAILPALEEIRTWNSGRDAGPLLASVNSEFLVSLVVLHSVLQETRVVAEALQRPSIDLIEAKCKIESIIELFSQWRENNEEKFSELFPIIEALAAQADVEIRKPRLVGRQRNRANLPGDTVQQYYRLSVFVPFLDYVLAALRERFMECGSVTTGLVALLPKFMEQYGFDKLKPAVEHYLQFLNGDIDAVEAEYKEFCRYWKRKKAEGCPIPEPITEVLAACDCQFYPNLCILLRIFATLPVTTCEGERSFSTMKHLKSYRRSTMAEDRLNGLAHMFIHKDLTFQPMKEGKIVDSVTETFCSILTRRLSF